MLLGDPSASLTLLSLSSISECNSTRSLLRSDSDEIVVYEMPVSPVEAPPLTHNPLVNVRVERFKRDPNQSLTPTHVTLTAPTQPSGHRRTPSDGALKPTGAPPAVASRSPSSNGMSPSPGTGEFWPHSLFSLLLLWPPGSKDVCRWLLSSFYFLICISPRKFEFLLLLNHARDMIWHWQGVQSWLTSLCPVPCSDFERRQAGCRKSQTCQTWARWHAETLLRCRGVGRASRGSRQALVL